MKLSVAVQRVLAGGEVELEIPRGYEWQYPVRYQAPRLDPLSGDLVHNDRGTIVKFPVNVYGYSAIFRVMKFRQGDPVLVVTSAAGEGSRVEVGNRDGLFVVHLTADDTEEIPLSSGWGKFIAIDPKGQSVPLFEARVHVN